MMMANAIVSGAMILCFGLLVAAALHDAAVRTIPNSIPIALAVVGVPLRIFDHTAILALAIAFGLFLALSVLWLRGFVGGGDMKLIPASALVLSPSDVPSFILFVSLAGGVLALIYLGLSHVVRRPSPGRRRGLFARILKAETWRLHRRGPLPYAVAITLGATPLIVQTIRG